MSKGGGIAIAIGAAAVIGGVVFFVTRSNVGSPPIKANDTKSPKCGDIVGAGLQLGSQVAAQANGAPPPNANLTVLGGPICKATEAIGSALKFFGKESMAGGKAVVGFVPSIGKGTAGKVAGLAVAPVTVPVKATIEGTKKLFKSIF